MRREYLSIICCPHCMGEFDVRETKTENDDILEGSLRCMKCQRDFPIRDGTAYLLPDGIPPGSGVPIRILRESSDKRH